MGPPGVDGLCLAAKPRWTFSEEKGCYKFIYGGCGGNSNRFISKEDCLRKCQPNETEEPCSQPDGVVGRCRAGFKRWTFSEQKGCYQFIYGGCDGNANNFFSKENCLRTCKPRKGGCPPGKVEVNTGACTASIPPQCRTECRAKETECQRPCPRGGRPFCGTDGNTYANHCVLDNANCESRKEIKFAYWAINGKCTDNKACCRERWSNHKKPAYEKACVDEDGKTRKAGETWGEGGCHCWPECKMWCPVYNCTCGKVDKCTTEQEDPDLWKKPVEK